MSLTCNKCFAYKTSLTVGFLNVVFNGIIFPRSNHRVYYFCNFLSFSDYYPFSQFTNLFCLISSHENCAPYILFFLLRFFMYLIYWYFTSLQRQFVHLYKDIPMPGKSQNFMLSLLGYVYIVGFSVVSTTPVFVALGVLPSSLSLNNLSKKVYINERTGCTKIWLHNSKSLFRKIEHLW